VALFFATYEDVIGFDPAVSRYDDRTESQTLGSFDALGEIDFFVHLTATLGFRYHRKYHSLSSYSKQRSWRRGGILRTPDKYRALSLFFNEFQLGSHGFAIKTDIFNPSDFGRNGSQLVAITYSNRLRTLN